MDIGTLIKETRIQVGITQSELARRCNLSKQFINRVESGGTDIQVNTLSKILIGLGKQIILVDIE